MVVAPPGPGASNQAGDALHQHIGEQIDAGSLDASLSVGGRAWRTVAVLGATTVIGVVALHGRDAIAVRINDARGSLAGWQVSAVTSPRTVARWNPSVRLSTPGADSPPSQPPHAGGGPSAILGEATRGPGGNVTNDDRADPVLGVGG